MAMNPLKDPVFLVIRKEGDEHVAAAQAVFEDRELAQDVANAIDKELEPGIVRLEGLIGHVLRAMIVMAKQEVGEPNEPTKTPQSA